MYKWRHLVENFFCKIREFRRIATRYDKTDTSFSAMINLVGAVGDVPAHVANGRALLINDYAASPVQARAPSLVVGAEGAA